MGPVARNDKVTVVWAALVALTWAFRAWTVVSSDHPLSVKALFACAGCTASGFAVGIVLDTLTRYRATWARRRHEAVARGEDQSTLFLLMGMLWFAMGIAPIVDGETSGWVWVGLVFFSASSGVLLGLAYSLRGNRHRVTAGTVSSEA